MRHAPLGEITMTHAHLAILGEVESAIERGSAEKRLEAVKRITDLFLRSAGRYSSEQLTLFDNVLGRLIRIIEARAIANLSARHTLSEISANLSSVVQAPPSVVRSLAWNEDISIAGPILAKSHRLSTYDLVEIADTRDEEHLLAISQRSSLKEAVTDALLARRYSTVSRRVVNNRGARVSPNGFATVVEDAKLDPELAVDAGMRVDLPSHLLNQLVLDATDAVRSRLLARAPEHIREEIRRAVASVSVAVNRELSQVRNFTSAKHLVAQLQESGELDETALLAFAKQRKYEETVAALSKMSRSPVELIRPLMQSPREEGLLMACKAAGLRWETVSAVLNIRFASGRIAADELARARGQFAKITTEDAQRLLRSWQGRVAPRVMGRN
jgi:uncharacterized protein (DUF2336 family)